MKVKGTISEVQSSLDFYLRISSVGKSRTVGDLRRHFFRRFLEEEREQEQALLEEKLELEERKRLERLQEEKQKQEELELEERRKQELQQEQRRKQELLLEERRRQEYLLEEAEKEKDEESAETIVNDILEELVSENTDLHTDVEECVEPIVKSNSNASAFLKAVQGIQDSVKHPKEEKEFVSHGIYLDELEEDLCEDTGVEPQQETINTSEQEDKIIYLRTSFVEHGIYIDELEEVDLDDDEEEVISSSISDCEFVSHGIYIDEIETEDENENENEDYLEGETDTQEVVYEQEDEDTIEESNQVEDVNWEANEILGEYGGIVEEVEEPTEITPTQETGTIEHLEVSSVEDPVNVPSDIRSFLKMYPNSEVSTVLKYYSKKDVDKAIKLGRIYKRKNKLFI